jgi:hypothetical protein
VPCEKVLLDRVLPRCVEGMLRTHPECAGAAIEWPAPYQV